MIKNETWNGSNLNLNVLHEDFYRESRRRTNVAESRNTHISDVVVLNIFCSVF